MLSRREALYRSLASCGASLIAFIGFAHEAIGRIVFPWGPEFLGGEIGWHAAGVLAIVTGLCLLGGTLQVFRFPVVLVALGAAAGGAFFLVVAAVRYDDFHMFALAGLLAGLVTAYSHRKADRVALEP